MLSINMVEACCNSASNGCATTRKNLFCVDDVRETLLSLLTVFVGGGRGGRGGRERGGGHANRRKGSTRRHGRTAPGDIFLFFRQR